MARTPSELLTSESEDSYGLRLFPTLKTHKLRVAMAGRGWDPTG